MRDEILKTLGLPADVTDAEIVSRVRDLSDADALTDALRVALGMERTASNRDVLSAVQALAKDKTARTITSERQAKIDGLMKSCNMSLESAIEALHHQETYAKSQAAEDAKRAGAKPAPVQRQKQMA